MDLSTVLRNVKAHKYKNKAEFAADLNQIWENCHIYNTSDAHPLRASARFMQQKANHHLEFLVDRIDRSAHAKILPIRPSHVAAVSSPKPVGPTVQPTIDTGDAAGESDADGDDIWANKKGSTNEKPGQESKVNGTTTPKSRGRSVSRARATSAASSSHVNGEKANGNATSVRHLVLSSATSLSMSQPPPFRPKLQTSFDIAPALIRTPQSMTQFLSLQLNSPSPSFSEKGKAKEILYNHAPPSWYPTLPSGDEDYKLEGCWWGTIGKDEALVGGLPSVPKMAVLSPKIRHKKLKPPIESGDGDSVPSLTKSRPVSMEKTVLRTVDKLFETRYDAHRILEWQRIEAEGGCLTNHLADEEEEKQKEEERIDRKRKRRVERGESRKRRKSGGEVGEREGVLGMKKACSGLLAHAGFEGANEIALDMFTTIALEHFKNLGNTFRLLIDGFSQQMSSEEIILHALHENGRLQPMHLETHIKDDIERESIKVNDMARKMRIAHKEISTAPVIEDDMMFAADGEMLLDGNFAEELGEDFLGLRDLGIDKEFGMTTLNVPTSVFYGRRKRLADAALQGAKVDIPDYPPPPAFIPVNPSTLSSHLPGLLHAFYAARLESGMSMASDDPFDPSLSQIGPLGQIIAKGPAIATGKKKGEGREGSRKESVQKIKKVVQPGVGKGNWIRPSKEERQRRAEEKRRALEAQQTINGIVPEPVAGEEEDAEGEEE
ncbi:transcriptional activator SPT7, partial [Tremellales sp. Uapishka_1]